MDFKTKWYSPENKPLEIPTFQDLQNVTGQAFDDFGNYVGKKEMPKQQLVIDKLTQRQYYAPEEYSEDAIRYGKAKIDESFKPKDWYGMTQIKPNYKFMEHISAGYISTLKSLIKPIAELPTKIVYAGAVGLNAISRGNFQSAETLYRSSMKNWEQTLDKAGLGADPELQDMLTVKIGSIAGQTASSLLIAAAVSSVGGLPAVAAVFGSQQFADVMEEGLAKGLSHKKAVSVAFQAAVAEGGLEAVGFRLWSGAASMNKSFRNIALGFLWEGAQEGSQQIAESAITNFYGLREQDLYEIMAEVALSALVGGLVGGVGAGLSGQVEQRNIALKKEIGMTEKGNIVTPNTEKKETGVMLKPSKEAEKQFTDQEIAEAKRTGDNKLYNIIKNIANAHGITDEKIIDKLYPVCRKMVSDGATLSNLQDIIGQQVVAYKNQLDNNQIDKEANDKAVEQIKLVTDPNRVDEWRESRKSELEKIGFTKEQAGTLTDHLSTITHRLSERLGFDITKKKEIYFSPNLSERAGTRGQIELGKTVAKVALNKNADPTTVEHEFFHYIDRVVLDAAKEGNVEAQKLVKKRYEIIKKAKSELKKRGIKDMPIDEEILASAYEKWLWQGGKSEDAYEQRLFNAIREFFREVYDTVKGLMGIRISPEMDAYFRAMTGEGKISYQSATETLFQEGIKYEKNGKADTNSPEFKKWFGDSKVVDENGKPLVVYHGTEADFNEFDMSKGRANMDIQGAFFSPWELDAKGYGKNVRAFYLSLKNPADEQTAYKALRKYQGQNGAGEKAKQYLIKQGYDGVINNNEEYIAFDPTQIKSVYNRGTFDTESPNIYYQQETNEQLYRNDQALKEGAKVLDKAPTNEQVEKELATIRSGRVVESEPKRGFGLAESIGDFVLTVRQRVGTIDKRLKYAFDKLDFNEKMYESKYGKNVVGYIKKYRKLDDTKKRELDYLILNKQDERIREFVRQNDMLEEYNQARTLLDNLYVEGNKAGMDMGFLQEYFPTKVVDPEGLITYLKGTDKWTEIERALAEIDPNNQMSIEDRANAINNILRGYNRADPISKQGFQNERLIFHKTPEMMKFYAPSDEALMRYVSGMSSALAIRNAFNVKNAFNAEESIGGVVQELIKSGQITYKEEAFIRKMLKARLNYARTAPMVALLKNFGYLGTMNNITSAVTQIGDLYANFYKYNFGTSMKALFGKREITKEDLHIDSIWEEFADSGWTGIAVNKLFSAIGLNKMDAFGKNTSINGAWIDLKERLKNNDVSLLEDLSAAFGSRSKQVMEDIKNNNITEDVKLLIWTQLADTQPLGKSGVPVGYLNNPHGRIIYQLKTYTINQLSLFYADGIYKINKGLATKNKKLFLQGVGNTAKLALLLTIFNAGADALKNLIMGRKIDISDTLLSNMLWNIGVSKYTFYRGQRDGYARALLENYLLPPQISMGDDAYMDIKKIAKGNRKPSDTIAVTYVPFGRMWYWWFGGGRTQEKKKGNKPFEVEL